MITKIEELISDSFSINHENINLIIFPDWSQPEESLITELEQVVKAVATHPQSNKIILLIDSSNINEEDANLILSAVIINLLVLENLDVTTGCEISLLGLDSVEWESISSCLHARIMLKHENQEVIQLLQLTNIAIYNLINFCNTPFEQLIYNLSNRLFNEGRWQAAIHQYQIFLKHQQGNVDFYYQLSECYWQLNLTQKCVNTMREAVKVYPQNPKLHFTLIIKLLFCGFIEEAISSAETAHKLLPNDYTFLILKYLIVPTFYNNQDEIQFYRKKFIKGLENLIQQTSLETPEERNNALAGIGRLTNFYISFQAQNDIQLQRQYGNLVHKIMVANYPEWVVPISILPVKDNKIRIGYASAYLHSYSGTLWLTGWLRYCNRDRFEIYCYYTGNSPDAITQQFQQHSDVFHHIPHNLEVVSQQIIGDELQILVYPEIGMDPQTMQMAGLRLAPIQCVAWGHPVTTGLPTIDYFLSSELMEPENAQEHYSEKLVLLPKIGVSYPKPYIPPVIKSRSDFQLSDDAVIYLSCQAPSKYLPQYDFIFAEIARRVPKAKFVFLRGECLKERLNRAFAAVGFNSEDYCIFLTIPERLDYLMINLLSDVYLDTLSWSGGNTSLEAIACNLPIVTSPGEFMRGRHTYSFLKMLEVTDTIADNEAKYIDIAVKLGLDPAWRNDVKNRIKERHDLLFDDKACVNGLEAFYQEIASMKGTACKDS